MLTPYSDSGATNVAQEAKPTPAAVPATGEPRTGHADHLH